jgi:hypothetical protein
LPTTGSQTVSVPVVNRYPLVSLFKIGAGRVTSRKHRMEGKRSADGGAAPSHGDHHDSVEQYRDFIVEGEIYQALDLSRRLLQVDGDHAQRADTARLLLDRLRSNRDDSGDHTNALLRVLANYAISSKELTEELLSLLFFCEHRVQIIHYISKVRKCDIINVDFVVELTPQSCLMAFS